MATQKATERRLVAAITDEFANAEGALSDEMQAHRLQAIAYYQCRPRGDEKEGRSQVISPDLASSVNATLALMRQMLIEECSVTFEAYGPEDEPLAKAESDIVSDVIFKDNPGSRYLLSAIKDSLLSRQAVMAVDVEELEDGQNEISIRPVPSENVAYQAGYEGDLQSIRFFAEMVPYTRSDLIEMGIDRRKVEKLADRSGDQFNGARYARNPKGTEHFAGPERAGDIIGTHWIFIRLDLDGDGVAELHRVLYADETVLKHEEFDVIPYAMGSPFITPHRLTGESLHDRVKQVQDVNTSLHRQLIDNVAIANNARVIYDPSRVNEEDVLTPQAGGGIRSRDPGAVVPMATPDVTGGILGALEFFRRKRSEVAGSALDMASADAQLMQKSATQASIDKSNSELVTSLIAHNLAETMIRDLFKLVHLYLRTYATRPYIARVAGQAIPINPVQAFAPDRRIIVKAGKSPGEKAQMAQALGQHVALQAQAMQLGMDGILADAQTIYRSQMEFLRLNGVPDVETHAIDPSSPQAQQASQAKAEQAEQMAAMQQQMAKMAQELEKMKVAEDARQADQELRFKYDELAAETEMKITELTANAEIDLEKQARDQAATLREIAAGSSMAQSAGG